MGFKSDYSFDVRQNESTKIMTKYPTKIPVIVEKYKDCHLKEIDKKKYLVTKDLLMNQFLFIIRKRINLDPSQSLFITVNNQMCPSNSSIFDIYEKYSDKDGFLYIVYTSENTFG